MYTCKLTNVSYHRTIQTLIPYTDIVTVVIPDMNETLLSVYQICNGGSENFQCISVFSNEGCRIFKFDTVREALKLMHDHGTEIMRGTCH